MAPTGHTDAHDGSSQCMHIRRTYLSPRCSTTVKAVAESVGSGSAGWLWPALHALSQARQPMHFVMSINNALRGSFIWPPCLCLLTAALLREEEFVNHGPLHTRF